MPYQVHVFPLTFLHPILAHVLFLFCIQHYIFCYFNVIPFSLIIISLFYFLK